MIGLEWAGGLPGTLGAAVRGNVGAFGGEIKDTFLQAKVLEKKQTGYEIKTLEKKDLHFSYRHSLIKDQRNLIITAATLQFHPANTEELTKAQATYHTNITYRKDHHPIEYPTCGSVFKNIAQPEQVKKILDQWPDLQNQIQTKWHGKVAMGYIIHRLGLTGYRVGNMQVSDKHSNFIINLGNAHAQDVLTIIQEIQNKVYQTFGFTPEVEVEIVK